MHFLFTAHLHSGIVYFNQLLLKSFTVTHQYTLHITGNPASPPGQRTDKDLVDWLQLHGADANAIEKVNLHTHTHTRPQIPPFLCYYQAA